MIFTVGADFKTKLSDFGLARGVHENDYYKMAAQTPLPLKWLAPEVLLYRKFSTASDVWYVTENVNVCWGLLFNIIICTCESVVVF